MIAVQNALTSLADDVATTRRILKAQKGEVIAVGHSYGGAVITNAATGIANIWEICHHLRGEAGERQIENAKVGLAHVIGLGSACGVYILEKSAA